MLVFALHARALLCIARGVRRRRRRKRRDTFERQCLPRRSAHRLLRSAGCTGRAARGAAASPGRGTAAQVLDFEEGPAAVADEELQGELREISANVRLSEQYLALARDLDVMEPKAPDEARAGLLA